MSKLIKDKLDKIKTDGLLRETRLTEHLSSTTISVNGKVCLNLCSNDYLGLSKDDRLKEAAIEATEIYGTGAGASRLVSGTMRPHIELEEALKGFKMTENAVVFNSGYHANIGVIPALISRDGEVFSDRLNHASIIDGVLLSRAKFNRYPHRDIEALESQLKKSQAQNKLIITDGVFSMDGDLAPLKELRLLADKYRAMLFIDDAHGTGTLGKEGRGTLEHLGVELSENIIQMGTFGKALGSFGAYVAGSSKVIELIKNKARSFIFTTALPPAVVTASAAALSIISNEPERRARLAANAGLMREKLRKLNLNIGQSETHIIPIIIKDSKETVRASERLKDLGFFIQAIRPPTIPEGTARLRLTVSSEHTAEELKGALAAIKEVLR
jgi:8-amino-7-oxononanoate synthase